MDSRTSIKGGIVFAITFGVFAIAKPHTPGQTPNSRETPTAPAVGPVIEAPTAPVSKTSEVESGGQSSPTQTPIDAEPQTINPTVAEVNETIRQWASSILSNDAQSEASYYAPVLVSYYERGSVDNAFVRADKQAFIDHGNNVTELNVEGTAFEIASPASATVHFVKNVTWQNAHGSVHKLIPCRLTFEKSDSVWKITSEEDFR